MPWDQQSYKPKRKKAKKKVVKKAKKAKKSAKSISLKACSKVHTSPSKPGGDYCTARSPGGIPDPEVDEIMLRAAFEDVGTPKKRRHAILSKDGKSLRIESSRAYAYPKDAAYLTVAYGGGVDSTAILVGLDQLWRETRQQKWVPVAITFSDTGGEHPHTYEYILKWLEPWLKKAFRGAKNRPTSVTKVCYSTSHTSRGWGTGYTLETQNLINHSLPSISMGGHTCSTKYKIDAQHQWMKSAIANGEIPDPGKKKKIIRAIGYDSTEVQRITSKSGTYVSQGEQSSGQKAWYPLVEWGWTRARCMAEAKVAIGRAPAKSSCWFCGAMRPTEILLLAKHYPKLMDRALFMEQVAKHGRNRPHGGLNMGGWFWTDFVLGDIKALDPWPSALVHIQGGVVRQHPTKIYVPRERLGKPCPPVLAENETYVEAAGAVYTKARVDKIVKLAKEWVRASHDYGHRIPGWRTLRRGEKPAGRKTRQKMSGGKLKTQVATTVADKAYKGILENDMGLHPMTRRIAGFSNMLGFRCVPEAFAWNTLEDKHLIEARITGKDLKARNIERVLAKGCRSRAANPPGGRRLPVVVSESPLLTGF
jgi:hypothetical protein